MKNCVNKNSKEVIKLARELELSPATVAAKIGVWQNQNNSLEFPTAENLKGKIKEGVEDLFESVPKLKDIGTKEQYSEYLETLVADSQVKDIVYREDKDNLENFSIKYSSSKYGFHSGIFFSTDRSYISKDFKNEKLYSAVISVKNLHTTDKPLNKEQASTIFLENEKDPTDSPYWDELNQQEKEEYYNAQKNKIKVDGIVGNDSDISGSSVRDNILGKEYVVNSPEQVHILGSKKDLKDFKNFVASKNKQNSVSPIEVSPEMREIIVDTVKEVFRKKGVQSEEEANKLFLHPTLIEAGYSFSNFEELGKLLSFIPASTDTLFLYTSLPFIELLQEQYIKGENFDKTEELQALKEEYTTILARAPIQGFSGAILPSGEFIESFENYKKVLENSMNQVEDEAFSAPTTSNTIVLNDSVIIENKKNLIKNIKQSIETLSNEQRTNKDDARGKVLAEKKRKAEERIVDIEKEIDVFIKNTNTSIAEKSLVLFEQDFSIIMNLLKDPTGENIKLAKELANIFEINREPRRIADSFMSTLDANGRPTLTTDSETKDLIDKLNKMSLILQNNVENALENFIIETLRIHEEKLKNLFPGLSMEEIKEEILKPTEDISIAEQYIFGQGAALNSNDLFEQVQRVIAEQKKIKSTNVTNEIVTEINDILPLLEKEMGVQKRVFTYSKSKVIRVFQKIFIPFKNFGVKTYNVATGKEKIYSVPDYHSLFFRQDVLDNELVTRYSKKWDDFLKEVREKQNAFFKTEKATQLENSKIRFNLINRHAEFLNIGLLHDLFENPADVNKKGTSQEAEAYKQEIISKISEPAYEELIKNQKRLLDNYASKSIEEEQRLLSNFGVTSVQQLSSKEKLIFDRSMNKMNPFMFSEEFHATGKNTFENGRVPFNLLYNSFIPRRVTNDSKKEQTNFYDANFDTILNNPVYLQSWKVFEKALNVINSNLAQSGLQLKSSNIPNVEKLFKELFLANSVKEMTTTFFSKSTLQNTMKYARGIFSERTEVYTSDSVKAPGQIANIKFKIESAFTDIKTELLNTVFNAHINLDDKTLIHFDTIIGKRELFRILGVTNSYEFTKLVPLNTAGQFRVKDLKVFAHKQVLDNQTQDLPTVLKMLLEQSADFNARVQAKQEIDVLRLQENKVDNDKGDLPGSELMRRNARIKSNYFYKKALLMQPKSKAFIDVSKMLLKHNSQKRKKIKNIYSTSFIGTTYYKNMTSEDKRLFKIYVARLEVIEKHLKRISPDDPNLEKVRTAILEEKSILLNKLDSLGESYTASAFITTIALKTALFAGMAFSPLIVAMNYMNARMNFKTTGLKYFTENSVDLSWSFVEMNTTRHFNPGYEKQWDILTHFIGKFDIIQDATNELQRAEKLHRNVAPELWTTNWLTNPMYGTEFIEYYNQLPTVVASLMNQTIVDPVTNETLPLFNGKEFTAHELIDGKIVLKAKFRTPENIAKFEDFTHQSSVEFIGGVKNIIRELNGDYSALGATYIKSNIAGQIVMLFKTWMGKKIESAYKYQRRNLTTGKVEDGYITGSILNKEVRGKGVGLLSMLLATGALTTGAIASAPFLALMGTGAAGFGFWAIYAGIKTAKKQGKRFDEDQRESMLLPAGHALKDTLLYLFWETPVEVAKYPLKGLTSIANRMGIELPREYLYDITKVDNLSEGQKNIKVLQQKVIANVWLMAIPFIAQLFASIDDDDEELKGNAEEREYWLKKHDKEYKKKEKTVNLIKNVSQKMLDENNFEILPTQIVDAIIAENKNIERGGAATGNLSLIMELGMYAWAKSQGEQSPLVSDKKSMDYGDTQLSSKFKKTFLPGIVRNYDKEAWNFGFEGMQFRDKVDNAIIDSADDTDYKVDRKAAKRVNSQTKVKARTDYSKKYYKKEYGDLSDAEKEFVDEIVATTTPKQEVNRKDYTLDQKKK